MNNQTPQPSANSFDNEQSVEMMWAIKAYEHSEIYFNILCSVDPKYLKLTPIDDTIYNCFRNHFPNMNIEIIDEDEMKSAHGKIRWREFCELFKNCVEDYSFGTLLRRDCNETYTEKNSMFVTRIQFYAIEIARNREGLNDNIRKKFQNFNNSHKEN